MGGCTSNPESKKDLQLSPSRKGIPARNQEPPSKFKQLEIYLLELMYADLAKRSRDNIVSRDTFQAFFNNSGLMAELMFSRFDQKKTGTILKEEFYKAFQINVKGSFEERADALFQFYSMEKAGGIRYAELLRILLSYPVEDINKMVFEQKFLKELGDHMISYYFGPQKKIQDKVTLEEQSQISTGEAPFEPTSLYHPSSSDLINIQGRIQKIMQEQSNNKKGRGKLALPPLFKKQHMSVTDTGHPQDRVENGLSLKKSGSMSLVEVKKIRKSCKIKSNITSVAKRYANFLFTSANLDKEKDFFQKKQFCQLLRSHPSIFDVYLAGFHTHIWELESNAQPKYASTTVSVQGRCKMGTGCLNYLAFLKLLKNTILVFDDREAKKPKQIINLQGLIVDIQEQGLKKTVKLKHRDNHYPQISLTFLEKEPQWLQQLKYFKDINSFITDYVRLQRIGKGNFSTVYKCKSKTKGELAALKIIDLLKLSQDERQVLKRQIGILKQCSHIPGVVKFIKEYKTQTKIYILTELCTEGDLFEYTRKKGFLEEYEAAKIFRQLTETILDLNEQGIIHRDLKPENIMITMRQDKSMINRVKIIDFGFGIYKDQLSQLPAQEKYAGTPGFMAPEVLQLKEYDQKIDTFSLGIILYFMLYGYLPFQSNYYEQIRQMTLSCDIKLQNNHWSNVSQQAKDLIYKILTFSKTRISTKEVMSHPWLQKIQCLKSRQGSNKKRLKILT